MNSENGHRLAQQFNEMGFRVEFVKQVASPQIITYYFNCLTINQFSKKRVESLLEKISAYNHIKFAYVETSETHFAISHPIPQRQPLWFSSFSFTPNYTTDIKIPIGKDLNNNVVSLDFGKIPHILIGGTTGSGKSVLINTIICSLYATTPKEMFELVLIDPKRVELSKYKAFNNVKFIEETNEAVYFLSQLVSIMEQRYAELEKIGRKNGDNYFKPLFVIVDELADLMLSARYECEESVVRLAQKGRACGIHLLLATQRPTVNVVSGLIKSNLPCRIALKTASFRDSITLIDKGGAEKLLGFGDSILKLPYTTEETRLQVAYCDDDLINQVIKMRGGE